MLLYLFSFSVIIFWYTWMACSLNFQVQLLPVLKRFSLVKVFSRGIIYIDLCVNVLTCVTRIMPSKIVPPPFTLPNVFFFIVIIIPDTYFLSLIQILKLKVCFVNWFGSQSLEWCLVHAGSLIICSVNEFTLSSTWNKVGQ